MSEVNPTIKKLTDDYASLCARLGEAKYKYRMTVNALMAQIKQIQVQHDMLKAALPKEEPKLEVVPVAEAPKEVENAAQN